MRRATGGTEAMGATWTIGAAPSPVRDCQAHGVVDDGLTSRGRRPSNQGSGIRPLRGNEPQSWANHPPTTARMTDTATVSNQAHDRAPPTTSASTVATDGETSTIEPRSTVTLPATGRPSAKIVHVQRRRRRPDRCPGAHPSRRAAPRHRDLKLHSGRRRRRDGADDARRGALRTGDRVGLPGGGSCVVRVAGDQPDRVGRRHRRRLPVTPRRR